MMLFHVWSVSGADPYQVFNGLDTAYRPLHDPSLPARPPQFPERVRAFLYACGLFSREIAQKDAAAMAKAMRGK